MKKITVSTVRETAKALLVQDEIGRQGWVQKRWAKGGEVNAETFEKAAAELSRRAEVKQAAVNFRNEMHRIEVSRETEKAVACGLVFEMCDLEKTFNALAWFPKSRCEKREDGWYAPGWMISAKEEEAYPERRFGSAILEYGCTGKM